MGTKIQVHIPLSLHNIPYSRPGYQPKCMVSIRLSFLNDIHKSVTHSCIDRKQEKYSIVENSNPFLYTLDMIIESIDYVPL